MVEIIEMDSTLLNQIQMLMNGSNKSYTFNLKDSVKDVEKVAKDSLAVNDSYGNTLTGTGSEDKIKSFANYGFSNDTLNWMLWIALYNDSWVFRRAIDKPSQDMVRCGITIKGDGKYEEVYSELKRNKSELINLISWGRLFGGSVGVMLFDNVDDKELSNPMNDTKISQSKYMKLYVTDRWYGVEPSSETVTEMGDLDFGKPKFYNITFSDGKRVKVHHDYILRYENRFAPRLIKSGQLQGWGYAEGAHILNELSRDDQLKSDITSLVNKSLIEVIKMAGMTGIFMGADKDSQDQLEKRLEMVNWGRNFNSLTFLDKDDEYQMNTFSGVTGLADLLEKNMWLVSAALDMQGVLYGHLNNGFSEDNEALERYNETIQNLNDSYYRPVLEKLVWVLYKKYKINEKVEFDFNSLLSKKQDKDKMDGMKAYCDLLSQMLTDGVITTKIYAEAMKSYAEENRLDLHMDDSYINGLDDKMEEEMENIDIDKSREGVKKIVGGE